MNGLSFFPSLVKLLFQLNAKPNIDELSTVETKLMKLLGISTKRRPIQKCTMFTLNFLAILMQISLTFIVIFSDFSLVNTFWKIPLALLLVSVSLTKNIYTKLRIKSDYKDENDETWVDKMFTFFRHSFTNMEKSRHKIGLFTSVWSIGIKCLFVHIFLYEFKFDTKLFAFNEFPMNTNVFRFVWPLITQVGASIIFYLSCSLAFKLCMRRICFALPLTLITPVSLGISLLICNYDWLLFDGKGLRDYFVCYSNYSHTYLVWHLVLGVSFWWISHLWVTNSIWNESQKETETDSKRSFKFQYFNTSFCENSLMLDSCSNLRDEENNANILANDNNNKNDTVLYICATLWHENNHEMLQLLKSIMRYDSDQKKKGDGFFEAHIFFDDAIECNGIVNSDNESRPNCFVQSFIKIVRDAADFMHKRSVTIDAPMKMITPYGGRLVFKLPGSNSLVIHLKDKTKIRIKKVKRIFF